MGNLIRIRRTLRLTTKIDESVMSYEWPGYIRRPSWAGMQRTKGNSSNVRSTFVKYRCHSLPPIALR